VDDQSWIPAQWPAPENIIAGITTRIGGNSEGDYSGFNLALHVGDDEARVNENRQQLKQFLQLTDEPLWLDQVHGCRVLTDAGPDSGADSARANSTDSPSKADASTSSIPGQVCVVMTADCLPVLITDKQGKHVAAVHAGWRGLDQEIILRCVETLPVAPQSLLAWLGPAIGPQVFEIGNDVRDRFLQRDSDYIACFITSTNRGKWLMDMYAVARLQLASAQVEQVFGGQFCTYTETERFYSFRRDKVTGRMASLIWIRA